MSMFIMLITFTSFMFTELIEQISHCKALEDLESSGTEIAVDRQTYVARISWWKKRDRNMNR